MPSPFRRRNHVNPSRLVRAVPHARDHRAAGQSGWIRRHHDGTGTRRLGSAARRRDGSLRLQPGWARQPDGHGFSGRRLDNTRRADEDGDRRRRCADALRLVRLRARVGRRHARAGRRVQHRSAARTGRAAGRGPDQSAYEAEARFDRAGIARLLQEEQQAILDTGGARAEMVQHALEAGREAAAKIGKYSPDQWNKLRFGPIAAAALVSAASASGEMGGRRKRPPSPQRSPS